MTAGFLRWSLRCAASVLLVALLCFLMSEALPGDTAHRIAAARYDAEHVDAATTEKVRAELSLDKPVLARLADWMSALARGDFGHSLVTGRPALGDLQNALTRSSLLILAAWPPTILLGVAAGLILGRSRAGLLVAQFGAAAMAGLPAYVVGLGLGLIFSIQLGWLPVAGSGDAAHLVLPAATLVLVGVMRLSLVTARSAFGAAEHPSVAFARMKGHPQSEIATSYVLPLAAPAIIAYAFVSLALLLEGAAVVETVFNYPGVGLRLVDAVRQRDVPVVQAFGIAIAVLITTANGIADLLGRLVEGRR